MVRQLAKSIREYKRASIATPLLVSGEVLMECTIPFIIAQLVNEVKSGCDMGVIWGMEGFWSVWPCCPFCSEVWPDPPVPQPPVAWREICGRICSTVSRDIPLRILISL